MTTRTIFLDAMRQRICLKPNGAFLTIESQEPVDPAFEAILVANKPALLKSLRSKHHLMRQILAGEFDGAGAVLQRDLKEELFQIYLDPKAKLALDRLAQLETRNPHHQ